jgi:DNA gyrase subunit A
MRLHRLAKLEVEKIKKELEELKLLIADLKSILASPKRVLEIIRRELKEIRDKYGYDRRTELSADYGEIEISDLIEKQDVVVYIKRVPVAGYKSQNRGGKGVTAHKPKEEDFVSTMFTTNTHDDILLFTNYGKVYSIKGYEVPEFERHSKGRAVINILNLSEGEKVNAVMPKLDDQKGFLVMATKQGLIKKTKLEEFDSIRRVGKVAIKLNDGDELISVQISNGRDEILMASSSGKCIRFSEEAVRPMGRGTQGVKSLKLKNKSDRVVDMIVIKPNHEILTVSANGYGKRSDVEDYRLQSRAGQGTIAGHFNEKTGKLVNLKLIDPENDIMIIADNGIIIRMKAKEVSKISRDTQGVRMMRLKNEGKVVCVALTPPEAEEIIEDTSEE